MKRSATDHELIPDDRGTLFEPALSLSELAEQLHVSVQTLYDLRSQGRGPTGFRVGRHLRFRRSEIQAWLQRLEAEDLVVTRRAGCNERPTTHGDRHLRVDQRRPGPVWAPHRPDTVP
ncbi:MAG: helix-turn-helix domain-containing protein [Nocardioides sp.]